MPLFKGKEHVLSKPPKIMKLNDSLFVIPCTGEMFKTKKEFEDRRKFYDNPNWVCKFSGKKNLTFEEALKSEKESKINMKNSVQSIYADAICKIVDKNDSNMDKLTETCVKKLDSSFFVGEEVKFLKNKEIMRGYITTTNYSNKNSLPADKENSLKYKSKKSSVSSALCYDIKTQDKRIITSIPAESLERIAQLPNKETIKDFISTNFYKPSNQSDERWILDPNSSLRLNISANHEDSQPILTPTKTAESKRKSLASGMSCEKKKRKEINHASSPLKDFLNSTKKESKPNPDIVMISSEKNFSKNSKSSSKLKKLSKSSTSPKKRNSPKVNDLNTSSSSKPKKINKSKLADVVADGPSKKKMKQMTLFDMSSPKSKMCSPAKKASPKKEKLKSEKLNPDSPQKEKKKVEKSRKDLMSSFTKKEKSTGEKHGKVELSKKSIGKSSVKSTKKGASKSGSLKTPSKSTKKTSSNLIKSVIKPKKVSKEIKKSKMKAASKKLAKAIKNTKNTSKVLPFTVLKISSPSKSPSSSSLKTVNLLPTVYSTFTFQELQFKQALHKMIRLKAFCSRKHYMSSLTKVVSLFNSKFDFKMPEELKEDFVKKLSYVLSKKKIDDMKPEEKEEFLRKSDFVQKHKHLIQHSEKSTILDDKLLKLQDLPKLKLVSTPDGIPNELFGDVVMITELINSFQGLIPNLPGGMVNAYELMEALVAGRNGYGTLSKVLMVLLQTLLVDEIADDYEELGMKLRDIPVTAYTSTELLRLCLRNDDSIKDNDSSDDDDFEFKMRNDEVDEESISEMETTEFYDISPESKLSILSCLCHRILATYVVQKHTESLHDKYSKCLMKKISLSKMENEEKRKKMADKEKTELDKKSDDANVSNENLETVKDEVEKNEEMNDLASVVKNRRLITKKMQQEKEKQDEIKKKEIEMEMLKTDYKEAFAKYKKILRSSPIGFDRNHDRYWILPSSKSLILVEKGWSSFLDYHVKKEIINSVDKDDNDSDSDYVESNVAESNQELLPTVSQNLWFEYETIEEVNELMNSLGTGIRERHLKTQLKNMYSAIQSAAKYRSSKEFKSMDYATELASGLQEELIGFATDIKKGGLGTIDDLDKWSNKVNKAMSVQTLATLVLDLHNFILPKFFSKIFRVNSNNGESSKKKNEQAVQHWMNAVSNCQTYSRLHVLAAILESCIKWDHSLANVRCKICRRKACEFVCSKCESGFHLNCTRPVLDAIPEDDWLCTSCQPKHKERQSGRLFSKRGLISEESSNENYEENWEDESDSDSSENNNFCSMCNKGKDLVSCSRCPASFHTKCHKPPLRSKPRNLWACCQCVTGVKIQPFTKQIEKSSGGISMRKTRSSTTIKTELRKQPSRKSLR